MLGRPIEETLAFLIALIPAFTVHEFMHAFVAYRLGDTTAKDLGRLTLNPLKHLDLFGTLMVLLVGFGWAKPVPVNPASLRGGRAGMAVVAVAGPLSNLAMATAVALLWQLTGSPGNPDLVTTLLLVFVYLNVALLFFNLLPIPPLDGYRVVAGVLPDSLVGAWNSFAQIGPMILLALVFAGSFVPQFSPLSQLVSKPTQSVVQFLLGA